MLADFHFLRPEWLIAIPVVLVVAIMFARRRYGPGSWENIVDPALVPHVLSGSPRKGLDKRWVLLALVGVLGVLALAGPAWERVEQPVFRSEQALVVALDLSRSMDAADVSPSRLLRARLKVLDMLERRASGQTALVVYSSNAFTVTPLTTDTDTVAALVNSLGTDIMPSRGSYPIAAINKGWQLLNQAAVSHGEVLLITDGGSSPAAERVARDLREAGYTLSILGVGTEEGAPIPRATGGFVTDRSGNIAVPRLEENSLRQLADAGGGRYYTLTSDGRDLDYLLSGEVGTRAATDDSQATDQWHDQGPWILLVLLPLAALSFRRGWVFLVAIVILPVSEPVYASFWDDLWRTKDQQAKHLMESGETAAAAELFENNEWSAVAKYRTQNFAASAAQFAERGDPRNLYNLGNALAMQGEFETAIDAYEQVLEMDPGNEDAEYNRDLLQQMLDEQQSDQNQGQSDESQQSPNGEQSDSDNQNTEAQSQNDSEEGDPSERSEDENAQEDLERLQEELERAAQEAQENQSQEMTEEQLEQMRRAQEQQQAMEQWLRRIPNDPGGLLRRKFRYQYQRMGKDQDGNNLWPDNEEQPW